MTRAFVKNTVRKIASLTLTSALTLSGVVALSVATTTLGVTKASAAGLGGPVQLDGMDPVCHSLGESTGQYIAAVLKSLHDQATISGSNGSIAILGTSKNNACGASFDSANAGNTVSAQYLNGFASGSKPSWTLHSDAAAINSFFTALNNGSISPKVIWIADDWGRSSSAETALSNNAESIANFVNAGGGLFSNYGSYGWLGALLPDAQFVDGGCNGGPALSTDGRNAFPTLTDQMVEACWHGSFWGSYPGLVSLVEWPYDALGTGASPAPMAPVAIGGSNVVMPSSFTLVTDPPQAIPSDTVDVIATAIGLDGTIYSGVNVSFSITSGPHSGWTATATTGSDGKAHASLTYLSDGTDLIEASATVNGSAKTQTYELDWATAFTPTRYVDAVLGSMTVGTLYSNGVAADGRPAPTYAVTTGSLPGGLSLNTTTGAITGTPTTAGSFSFEITATNPAGTAAKTFTGSVGAPTNSAPNWSDNTLGSMQEDVSYSDGVLASGYPTPTYSVTSGSLPAGLTLDSTTGAITGTPTASGSFSFTVTASNSQGNINKSFSGTVAAPPTTAPSWTDTTLASMLRGSAYSDGVLSSGVPAATYAVTAGSLPAGLTLNAATGAITGTPSGMGAFSFEITASNVAGDTSYTFTGYVDAAPVWSDSTIGEITKGSAYNDAVEADAWPAATYAVTSGTLPTGLSLNTSTGAITGTSSATGSYTFEITASNTEGDVSNTFTGTMYQVPAWSDTELATFVQNVSYSDAVSASGHPGASYTITSGSLPAGLTLDSATGAITGTPTASGSYSFEITATSAAGSVAHSYAGSVIDPTPSWSDDNLSDFALAVPYNNGVNANSNQSVTYTITNGSLPAGLTLDSTTGAITGTPTASGPYSFEITATADGTSPALEVTLSFSGNTEDTTPTWSDSTLGDVQAGVPYTDGLEALSSIGVTYTVSAGSLPAGITLDSTTGAITGLVQVPGTYYFEITATSDGGSVTLVFSGTVIDNPPVFSDSNLADGTHGVLYTDGVAAGSYASVTYQVTSGSLPSGLTLDLTTGEITGTPNAPGTYTFEITATSDGGSVTLVFNVTIASNPPAITDSQLSDATQGTPYSDGVEAGSFAPVTYSVTSGILPAGLSLDSTTGSLTGTPTEAGVYSFTITASSDGGDTDIVVTVTVVSNPPVFSDSLVSGGVVGVYYQDAVSANNGGHTVTYSVTSGALPTGLALDAATGSITGKPTTAGNYTLVITATSVGGSVDTQITINVVSMSFEPVKDTENVSTEEGTLDFTSAPAGSSISVSPPKSTENKVAGTATIKDNKVSYVAPSGFSGLAKVVVSITVNGYTEEREYVFTVNPAPASSGEYGSERSGRDNSWIRSPRATGTTVVRWEPSPNAVGYEVRQTAPVTSSSLSLSNGDLLCSTTTETSCVLAMIAGPSTSFHVIALGRDNLRSTVVKAQHKPSLSPRGTKTLYVSFESESWELNSVSKAELRALSRQARAAGYKRVFITGNTDERGSIAYNNYLGAQRAKAVQRYLNSVAPGLRVVMTSKGSSEPVSKGTTGRDHSKNRRADVYLR